MTAVTTQEVRPGARTARRKRAGLPGTLRSELTKIISVRSTYWALALLVLASVAWSIVFCAGNGGALGAHVGAVPGRLRPDAVQRDRAGPARPAGHRGARRADDHGRVLDAGDQDVADGDAEARSPVRG